MDNEFDASRPDPDALLAAVENPRAHEGRLKIFLGAAPGVGKTYSMLLAAHKQQSQQVDVLVGLIETHGRSETNALLKGLCIFPRKTYTYRGKKFDELDVQGIFAKKPQLVLVDELAHTNVKGCQHKKRYLDVLDLLAAGIDVYTAVNIQHLESLNDDIQQITGIKTKETIPDAIIERADDIVVIDLTPEELIQRLREGKVYVPFAAQRAIRHYFSPANLTALRELALRTVAKNVGKEILSYKKTHGIAEPWAVSERVMICLSTSSVTPRLIRSAKRLAEQQDAQLIAVYVESPGDQRLKPEQFEKLLRYKRLAEQVGADVITLSATNRAKALLHYANNHNVMHIFMGKSVRSRLVERFFGSIVHEVIRLSGRINIHVLTESLGEKAAVQPTMATFPQRKPFLKYLYSAAVVFFVGAITYIFNPYLSIVSDTILFLFAIIFSAYRFGLYPSLLSAVLSLFIYLYFYVSPYYSFAIYRIHELLTVLLFICFAIFVSQLTGRVRAQAKNAMKREFIAKSIYDFTRQLVNAENLQGLVDTITRAISRTLDMQTVVVLPQDATLKLASSYPNMAQLDKKAWAALKWSWDNKKQCGRGSDTLSGIAWYFLPLKVSEDYVGVLGVKVPSEEYFLRPELQHVFRTYADQSAVAIARMSLKISQYRQE